MTDELKEYIGQIMVNINEDGIPENAITKVIVNKTGEIKIEIDNETIAVIKMTNANITINLTLEEDTVTIIIAKQGQGGDITYRIDNIMKVDGEELSFYLEMAYNGLISNVAKETYKLGIDIPADEEAISYEYTFENTNKFVSNVEIRALSEGNSVILNNQSAEYINTLIAGIILKVGEINNANMTAIGLDGNTNIFVYWTPFGMMMPLEGSTQNIETVE